MPSLISLPVNFYSVIMASRRSKDKTLATDNQIVKKEPASPLNIANRFTTLGTIPKPNYSSILASTYVPYALTNVHQPVQYAKEDDVLACCWYVKWWDKFFHTNSIINNVDKDFLFSNASQLKITTPVQKAVADAPASSSTKNVAPPVKSKKKGSPLDAIRKDPDALYALLTKMIKEDEAANSDAERSSQAFVTKDPYYPYP